MRTLSGHRLLRRVLTELRGQDLTSVALAERLSASLPEVEEALSYALKRRWVYRTGWQRQIWILGTQLSLF